MSKDDLVSRGRFKSGLRLDVLEGSILIAATCPGHHKYPLEAEYEMDWTAFRLELDASPFP